MSKKIPGLLSLMGTTVDRHYARQKYADDLLEMIIIVILTTLWIGFFDYPWDRFFHLLGTVYVGGIILDYLFFLRNGWKIKRAQSNYSYGNGD